MYFLRDLCAPAVNKKGTVSLELLVILVPVVFGLAGFAVDLGRLYLIRGELKTAASSMALAAAAKLIGTDTSLDNATNAAHAVLDNATGFANKYNFGGLPIGESTGFLNSTVSDPSYFDTLADATGASDSGGAPSSGGSTAKYASITVQADAPLLFWSFIPLAAEHKTTVAAQAVAGISAPLCTACAIEVLAIAALDSSDTTDFGFTPGTRYTFAYSCNGTPPPQPLGESVALPYLLLNRLNSDAQTFADEATQAYRIGAQGLPPSTDPTMGCVSVNAVEQVWTNAGPVACNTPVASQVTDVLCGIDTRFEQTTPDACVNIPEIDTLLAYTPDSDVSDIVDYASYTGNARRIITVAVVDSLADATAMTVQGFRQFLVEPNPSAANIDPSDRNGRFAALYLGSVMPLKQGRFDGCQISAGPGKVVLHQ